MLMMLVVITIVKELSKVVGEPNMGIVEKIRTKNTSATHFEGMRNVAWLTFVAISSYS